MKFVGSSSIKISGASSRIFASATFVLCHQLICVKGFSSNSKIPIPEAT
jgi:hypothetical protein